MKNNEKLILTLENLTFNVTRKQLDKKLDFLVEKLEQEGDLYGAVTAVLHNPEICVTLKYHQKSKGPTKIKIFGYDQDKFLSKQYKN